MKINNAPARKKARQLAAEYRANGSKGTTAREVYDDMPEFDAFRSIRTKKDRSSKSYRRNA